MENQFKMIGVMLIALIISYSVNAQVTKINPFHRIPVPNSQAVKAMLNNVKISAYRFTGPMAGYDVLNNKIVTGIGYGFQRLHFIDSTSKWYTDYSISGVLYAGGNAIPNLASNNIISVGVAFGFLNQLFMICPNYNLPFESGSKGKLGLIVNFSVPLN